MQKAIAKLLKPAYNKNNKRKEAFLAGIRGYLSGLSYEDNPYEDDMFTTMYHEWREWSNGWYTALDKVIQIVNLKNFMGTSTTWVGEQHGNFIIGYAVSDGVQLSTTNAGNGIRILQRNNESVIWVIHSQTLKIVKKYVWRKDAVVFCQSMNTP